MVYASHPKIWTKWSPPLVQHFDKNHPAARQQKTILSKMTQDLRDQMVTNILQRLPPNRWHPNSATNITNIWGLGIGSETLEVSGAEISQAHPIPLSLFYQGESNSPSGTEFSDNTDAGMDSDDDSVSENGGVSLDDSI